MLRIPRVLPDPVVYVIVDVVVAEVSIFSFTVRFGRTAEAGHRILIVQLVDSGPTVREQLLCRLAERVGTLIVESRLLVLHTALGRYQYDTVTGSRTVDRSGCSILQETHLVDFIRLQLVEVLLLADDTVDNEQRVTETTTQTDF